MAGLTVFIDPDAAPEDRQRELIKKALSEINSKCEFVQQRLDKSLSWQMPVLTSMCETEDIAKETMVILQASDAIAMVLTYLQRKRSGASEQMTLTEWIQSLQSAAPTQNLTVLAVGLAQYFSAQKRSVRQKHREAVTGQPAKARKKKAPAGEEVQVTHEEVEEAFVEAQLFTGCIVQSVESDEELANQLKVFTKAVAEKPSKKDRLNNVFSFLTEGTGGLRVSKEGEGLKRVWKQQLMQFKNLGPEMAEAICNVYPSPSLLRQSCQKSAISADAEKEIAEINVRRNASIIATNRKVGKEQARRINAFMTSRDPNEIIK